MPNCHKVERTLHFVFGEATPSRDRPGAAGGIGAVARTRAARRKCERLGLPPGTVLTFSKDPDITCTVAGPKSVLFRGEEQSPSAAADTAIREMGYNWLRISGSEHWLLDGVRLSAFSPKFPADL